ncbi:hypothetical protein CF326_g9677, partial [Tilletia indica]
MVRYLAAVGQSWTPAIRLALYKTLVRPLLDYGGALLWHTVLTPLPTSRTQAAVKYSRWKGIHLEHLDLNPLHRKTQDSLWAKTLRTHHSLATNWIACQRKETASLPALSSILGLNHPEDRMYKLAVLLQSHLQHLDPSSIVVARFQELTHFPPEDTTWSTILLARAGSDAVLQDLPSASETRTALAMGVRSKVEAHHKLRAYLLLRLKDPANGILPPYIFDSARLPLPDSRPLMTEPRPDRCIFLPDPEVRMRAIEWRIDKFATMCTCPGCGGKVRRTCVDRCADAFSVPVTQAERRMIEEDIRTHPELIPKPKEKKEKKKKKGKKKKGKGKGRKRKRDDDEYEEEESTEEEEVAEEVVPEEDAVPKPPNYGRGDAYLNRGQYKLFKRLVVPIDRHLRHVGKSSEARRPDPPDVSRVQQAKAV